MKYLKLFESYNNKRYFHGAKTIEGESIIHDGYIKPGNIETKRGHKLTPLIGRSYITPLIKEACIYAIGGVFLGHQIYGKKDAYFGYVFEVDTEGKKLLADEDYIGYAVYLSYHSLQGKNLDHYVDDAQHLIANWSVDRKRQFLHFAQTNLTPLQFKKCINYDDYGDLAVAGKKLSKIMPNDFNNWLLESDSSASVKGNIKIINAWKIDYEYDVVRIKKDGSNFFEIAKKII